MSITGEAIRAFKRTRDEVAVFDRLYQGNPRLAPGSGGHYDVSFHRTAKDRAPAKSVVTRQILGDPAPGRSAQDKLDALKR